MHGIPTNYPEGNDDHRLRRTLNAALANVTTPRPDGSPTTCPEGPLLCNATGDVPGTLTSEAEQDTAWDSKHGLKRDPGHAVQDFALASAHARSPPTLSNPTRMHARKFDNKHEADTLARIVNSHMQSQDETPHELVGSRTKVRRTGSMPKPPIVETCAPSNAEPMPAQSSNNQVHHRFNPYHPNHGGALKSENPPLYHRLNAGANRVTCNTPAVSSTSDEAAIERLLKGTRRWSFCTCVACKF